MKPESNQHSQQQSSSPSPESRREFLRGAATAAGVATAGAVLVGANSAKAAVNPDLRQAVRATDSARTMRVRFSARHKVTLEDVQDAVIQVLGETACPSCGLNGLDLRFGLEELVSLKTQVPAQASMEGGLLP